jgi:hypothetical protein
MSDFPVVEKLKELIKHADDACVVAYTLNKEVEEFREAVQRIYRCEELFNLILLGKIGVSSETDKQGVPWYIPVVDGKQRLGYFYTSPLDAYWEAYSLWEGSRKETKND